jgi:hypothetical protein
MTPASKGTLQAMAPVDHFEHNIYIVKCLMQGVFFGICKACFRAGPYM